MDINKPYLFIEIGNKEFVFLVVKYNENLDFQVLENIVSKSEGIENGKIIDISKASKIIKDNLNLIEKKLNLFLKVQQ